jgi:RNase P subunit RPR2
MEIPAPLMAKLLSKLDESWKHNRCDACGAELWTVLNRVWQLTEHHGNGCLPGGRVIPLVVAQCNNCGNMRLANAITLGVIDGRTGALFPQPIEPSARSQ